MKKFSTVLILMFCIQLDTYFGGGLNGKIEDLFINGGFTYRLDY